MAKTFMDVDSIQKDLKKSRRHVHRLIHEYSSDLPYFLIGKHDLMVVLTRDYKKWKKRLIDIKMK